jgi:hypothetical protein
MGLNTILRWVFSIHPAKTGLSSPIRRYTTYLQPTFSNTSIASTRQPNWQDVYSYLAPFKCTGDWRSEGRYQFPSIIYLWSNINLESQVCSPLAAEETSETQTRIEIYFFEGSLGHANFAELLRLVVHDLETINHIGTAGLPTDYRNRLSFLWLNIACRTQDIENKRSSSRHSLWLYLSHHREIRLSRWGKYRSLILMIFSFRF